jgi:L-seryl-tRNA(Ser) seleniumtransferase
VPVPSQPSDRPPSVERLLAAARGRLGTRDRGAVLAAARAVVATERGRLLDGERPSPVETLADRLVADLEAAETAGRPTVALNATGVIVHTNLGRVPWPAEAVEAASLAASSTLLLELDRASGRRGRRYREAEAQLVTLTGAEDALVTNNNAAAIALAVGLAGRAGVLVARGELVEIGGGVRIPEIVRRAGARLIEVGTTNRTRVADFEAPLSEGRARMVLRVHQSNFVQTGFVEAPDAAELARLAHAHGAIVVDDLGSGALLDSAAFGLAHEPMPAERLAAGADLVTFSGDKLVGGPQAGLIVGRADLVARLRRDPLARAMRPDKATLAGVAATLALYRAGVAAERVPVWRMIGLPVAELRARAERLAASLDAAGTPARVVELMATVGGGSLPGQTLPSAGLALDGPAPTRRLARLRLADPAVIGRIEDGAVVLDLRTVDPVDDDSLAAAIVASAVAAADARR